MKVQKKAINKKVIILFVRDALMLGTSQDSPTTITLLTRVLNRYFHVVCDRRTVSRNIGYLIECGEPVVKLPGGKVYYDRSGMNPRLKEIFYGG